MVAPAVQWFPSICGGKHGPSGGERSPSACTGRGAHRYAYADTLGHTHGYQYRYSNTHAQSDAHADLHSHADEYSNDHTHQHPDTHSHPPAPDSNPNTANALPDSDANCRAASTSQA
jgi:hypothetical protein